jgi:hypothetical protein
MSNEPLQRVTVRLEGMKELLELGDRLCNAIESHNQILEALVEAGYQGEAPGFKCPHCGESDPDKLEDTSSGKIRRITCLTCTLSTSLEAPRG